jgi:hypothetical protein
VRFASTAVLWQTLPAHRRRPDAGAVKLDPFRSSWPRPSSRSSARPNSPGSPNPGLAKPSPEFLSVYGTLFLTGSMAAARDNDRATTRTFLAAADESAKRLGRVANHLWAAFGPTNVAIHRVATAGAG